MSYHLPELSKQLAATAEEYLPKFSGQNKLLMVTVRFDYDPPKKKLPFGVVSSPHQYINVVFWHPGNAMLVAYNFESTIENILGSYIISANHTTWKYDGLDFFNEILTQPVDWEAEKIKILELKEAGIENNNGSEEFMFKVKDELMVA